MAKKYFLPRKDSELDEWLDIFITKLTTLATLLGVSTQELTDATTLKNSFKQALDDVNIKDAEKRSAVEQKNADKKAVSDFLRPLIQRIKNHPNYTLTHGEILRIIGAEEVVDIDNLQPELKVTLDSDRPKIAWKKGPADGINIYVNRRDGKGFMFLAWDTKPDYIDTFPVPADKDSVVWEYKAKYIINDEEVGKYSDVASITVTR